MNINHERQRNDLMSLGNGRRAEVNCPFYLTSDEVDDLEAMFAGIIRIARRCQIEEEITNLSASATG